MGKLIRIVSSDLSAPPDLDTTASIFEKEPPPILAYSTKWDNIKKFDEEERLRDLKRLREPSESHLLELIIVLACLALIIIIFIKCFCERSTPLQTWFNTKYRPGHAAAAAASQSRRTSEAVQNIEGISGAAAVTPVPANIFRPVKSHDANDKSPLGAGGNEFPRKKSHNIGMASGASDEDNHSPSPYAPTTTTKA